LPYGKGGLQTVSLYGYGMVKNRPSLLTIAEQPCKFLQWWSRLTPYSNCLLTGMELLVLLELDKIFDRLVENWLSW